MRVTVVLAGVAAMIVSAMFVINLLGDRPPGIPVPVYKSPHEPPDASKVTKTTGPQPKAVIDEPEFPFGRMLVGAERTHDFVIRNEGEALLTVEFGETTCQCTYSNMKKGDKIEIKPHESGKVTLTWKPTGQTEHFDKGATLFTNDPEKSTIGLKVVGMVTPHFTVNPSGDWNLVDSGDGKALTVTGALASPFVEQFNITGIESRSPLVSTEVVPIAKHMLSRYRALSGYDIHVAVKPEMPMGAFSYPLTIRTDVPDTSEGGSGKPLEFHVLLSGARRGPIRPTGKEWIEDKMAISLGSFEAAAGKKVSLPVVVKYPPAEGFKLTEPPICTPEAIKFDLRQDEKSTSGTPRYLLTVEYPPGSPRGTHREEDPGRVILKTNHPNAEQVEFRVFFAAY